jgi:hypothetical protein
MSDELDIRGGGAIAVDTDTLRTTAAGFLALAAELAELARLVGSAQSTLFTERAAWDAAGSASLLYRRLTATEDETEGVAGKLRAAAAMYEMAELNAAHASAVLTGDFESAARIDERRSQLSVLYPTAVWDAWGKQAEYWLMWPSELVRQATETWEPFGITSGVIGGLLPYALARTSTALGKGVVARDARLSGGPVEVRVWPVAASGGSPAASGAPANLAAAAARIPSAADGEARVRVEKYTMADGSKQYAVYVTGTKLTLDPAEPFSLGAAAELELGNRTASYEATVAALEDAGAQPGDAVHAFGHSQGGAITGHLALESEFDVKTLVSLGSPIEADVGPGTLSVSLRHTDDPIGMLGPGGGSDHTVGAPGSFIAHRVADPDSGLGDLMLPAHDAAAYVATAELLDSSSDPRMAAVRELFGELGDAVSVEVTEYAAERP